MKAPLRRVLSRPARDASSGLKIGSVGGFDVAYRSGTADEAVLQHSFDHDIFFTGVPEYRPAESDTIIDVGAHIGTFSLLAASKAPRGRVYAIEACEDTFNFLRVNVALNGLSHVVPVHLALSDREGTCTLYYDTGNWGHSVVSRLSNRSEVVRCSTLQRFFGENSIAACNFIKFNCEGAEFPILLSCHADFLRRIQLILVLYHGDLWKKNTVEDLLGHLQQSGFDCQVRNQTESRGWIVARRR